MKVNIIIFILSIPFIAISQCKTGDCNNGYGIYHGEDFTYKGEFQHGSFHGNGELTQGTRKYIGEFSNHQYSGQGKIYENKKILYEGEFLHGRSHGYGTLYVNKLFGKDKEVVMEGKINWSGNFEYGNQIDSLGKFNFENSFDPNNIISNYDEIILNLDKINGDFYFKFYFSNNLIKKYIFDTGCNGVVFSKNEFLNLKKNGLEFKKLPIKGFSKLADGSKANNTYYEFYNLELDNMLIKKLIVRVRDQKGGETLIGMGLFKMFSNYIMPNKKGKMTIYTN